MILSNQTIISFKALWLKKYGQKLDDQRAEVLALDLLEFVKAIYKNTKHQEVNNGKVN